MSIVFSANWDGDYDIYIIHADGSNLSKLTDNTVDDIAPVWSPDGKKIAFVSRLSGNPGQLYLMKFDGADQIPITAENFVIAPSAWSPDSRYIAFEGARSGVVDFYVVDQKGSSPIKVSDGDSYFYPSNLTWSLSSKELAYDVGLALTGTLRGVILVELNNPGVLKLLSQSGSEPAEWFSDSLPDWDWQDNWIALVSSSIPINENQIYIIRADGSDRQRLTDSTSYKTLVRWSPNGQKIAYGAIMSPFMDNVLIKAIYTINRDGTNERLIVKGKEIQGDNFSWAPNGLYLAYIASSLDNPDLYDLYYADICGYGTHLITKNIDNYTPSWTP